MKDAVGGGPLLRLNAARRNSERRLIHIGRPLRRRPIQEPRADAGAKQHSHPTDVAVLRLRFVPQHTPSVPRAGQPNQKRRGEDASPEIEQPQRTGDPAVDGVHQLGRGIGIENHRHRHANHAGQTDREHRPIHRHRHAVPVRRYGARSPGRAPLPRFPGLPRFDFPPLKRPRGPCHTSWISRMWQVNHASLAVLVR